MKPENMTRWVTPLRTFYLELSVDERKEFLNKINITSSSFTKKMYGITPLKLDEVNSICKNSNGKLSIADFAKN